MSMHNFESIRLSDEEKARELCEAFALRHVLFWTGSKSHEELNFRMARVGFWVWVFTVGLAAAAELLFLGVFLWHLLR